MSQIQIQKPYLKIIQLKQNVKKQKELTDKIREYSNRIDIDLSDYNIGMGLGSDLIFDPWTRVRSLGILNKDVVRIKILITIVTNIIHSIVDSNNNIDANSHIINGLITAIRIVVNGDKATIFDINAFMLTHLLLLKRSGDIYKNILTIFNCIIFKIKWDKWSNIEELFNTISNENDDNLTEDYIIKNIEAIITNNVTSDTISDIKNSFEFGWCSTNTFSSWNSSRDDPRNAVIFIVLLNRFSDKFTDFSFSITNLKNLLKNVNEFTLRVIDNKFPIFSDLISNFLSVRDNVSKLSLIEVVIPDGNISMSDLIRSILELKSNGPVTEFDVSTGIFKLSVIMILINKKTNYLDDVHSALVVFSDGNLPLVGTSSKSYTPKI